MNRLPYPFDRRKATRYSFVSKGSKGVIIKVVQSKPTSARGLYNLSFGDLQQVGTIDDTINTNNNDIMKVMATIVRIEYDCTAENPGVKIVFAGNSQARMSLYFIILRTYHAEFSKTHIISALAKDGAEFAEVPFDPSGDYKLFSLFRKKKIMILYYVNNKKNIARKSFSKKVVIVTKSKLSVKQAPDSKLIKINKMLSKTKWLDS